MVVEADSALRERVARALTDAGYEVSAAASATLKTVLQTAADVIVLGANPPQLNCCDLLADVKASEPTCYTRVIMLAHGGAAERVRGLELGADDVLSIPFDDRELLARVRTQIREKRPEDKLRETVRNERQSTRQARRVLRALHQGRRTLRLGIVVVAVFAVLASGIIAFIYWRSQRQTVRVYAALAKLQTGVANERQLVELARRSKTEAEQNVAESAATQRQVLAQENRVLQSKMAVADPSHVAELQKQLRASNDRLHKLESESTVAEDIIRSYALSVCLLHVAVAFRDKVSGQTLRYTTLAPPASPSLDGEAQVQIGGIGAEVRMDAFGTGFLVSSDGRIVTNHHVVEPWWKNDEIGELLKQAPDLEPTVADMTAYFPSIARGIPLKLQKISSEADNRSRDRECFRPEVEAAHDG